MKIFFLIMKILKVLAEDDIYIFLVFTFQKKSFHAIISNPNKTLWPNLSLLP